MRILLVEDDVAIARSLKEGLEDEAYAVDVAHDGDEGYRTAAMDDYDLIILDVMLPEMNGYEVCRALRQDGNQTPILMLTVRDAERDIVEGLDVGADDYLAKPFVLRCYWRACGLCCAVQTRSWKKFCGLVI